MMNLGVDDEEEAGCEEGCLGNEEDEKEFWLLNWGLCWEICGLCWLNCGLCWLNCGLCWENGKGDLWPPEENLKKDDDPDEGLWSEGLLGLEAVGLGAGAGAAVGRGRAAVGLAGVGGGLLVVVGAGWLLALAGSSPKT